MANHDKKALILDMYGVVISDPGGGLMPFVNRYFPGHVAADVYPHWLEANVGRLSSSGFFERVGFSGDLKRVETEYLETIGINESFYRAADILKEKYRLALLSNDISDWSRYLREKYGLSQYFEAAVVSGDVRLHKPNADIYELMLGILGVPAQKCVFVDDRRRNLNPARALGMDVILFNSRNVPYDGKIVNNFDELVEMLA